MELLLDTCVWGGAKADMHAAGHDVLWTGDLAQDPGDEEILAQAHREQRVLITLDKDFGELPIRRGLPHSALCVWSTLVRDNKALSASKFYRSMGTN